MKVWKLRISRRPVAAAAVLVGMLSLAIGAHAALNMRALDAAKTIATEQGSDVTSQATKVALVIGNGHYPDANAPLTQPINDARALTAALRRDGFDVDVVEDANKDDMRRAVARLKSKVRPNSVVMLFFGGYGVQVGRESYMIPVDAAIWKAADVRRDGLSVEQVLDVMTERGARAKLVVIDASRRNPYERRFRTFSHGLAPIDAARQHADPDIGDAGQGGRRFQWPVQRAGGRAAQQPQGPCRRRGGLQQDPRRRRPRLRGRTGAVGILVAAGRRPVRIRRQGRRLTGTVQPINAVFCHGRACCPGHPRLSCFVAAKTWMPGTSPGMTSFV